MGDAVTSQTLIDDADIAVMKFTNISDGTGESEVTKVDIDSDLDPAPSTVTIEKIIWGCSGMGVTILWDATSDVVCWHLGTDSSGTIDFLKDAGNSLINTKATGYTGDISFTTVGHTSGDAYSVILVMRKVF